MITPDAFFTQNLLTPTQTKMLEDLMIKRKVQGLKMVKITHDELSTIGNIDTIIFTMENSGWNIRKCTSGQREETIYYKITAA